MGEPRFRLSAKSFLLTWPRCDASKELCLDTLRNIAAVAKYVICREQHADGTNHLHAAVMFSRKLDVRNPAYFDITDGMVVYHGNYQSARRWVAAINYVKKGMI